MNNYVRKHNFGYGSCAEKQYDSHINKLELRTISDLNSYLKDLLQSQMVDTKVIDNIIISTDLPDVKIRIKKLNQKR